MIFAYAASYSNGGVKYWQWRHPLSQYALSWLDLPHGEPFGSVKGLYEIVDIDLNADFNLGYSLAEVIRATRNERGDLRA